jgi:HD-GYP domain-containing protein (c-di-GMP phosphodiesterase class II)
VADASRPRETFGTIGALAPMIEALAVYDTTTAQHLLHVDALAYRWGMRLERTSDFARRLATAALAHDLGKLFIPSAILNKPSRLDDVEMRQMRRHVEFGAHLMRIEPKLADVLGAVEQHHERFDGTGYPSGLRGDQIDPLARAVSIVDAYSAMTLERPYHVAISSDAALAEIERCSGTQFDPVFVESFIDFMRAEGTVTGKRETATARRARPRSSLRG